MKTILMTVSLLGVAVGCVEDISTDALGVCVQMSENRVFRPCEDADDATSCHVKILGGYYTAHIDEIQSCSECYSDFPAEEMRKICSQF
jgi:hypothetical protein